MTSDRNRVVVMGGSAGGIEVIARILSELPADIRAAVFVVVHLNASVPSLLSSVLSRKTSLRVVAAEDGAAIESGTVYTGSPDRHLLIDNGTIRLGRGPRENNFRPAVDPLFRSAALSHGADVIGVVLSGNLDDGTAGLLEIKRRGGIAIVQDVNDALYPGMPASALQEVPGIDYVLPAHDIARIITELAGSSAQHSPLTTGESLPEDIAMGGEHPVDTDERELAEGGTPSVFGCPSCGGVLWEQQDGEMVRYRCRVGHMFSDEALLAAQTENLETALWSALRALEEAAEQSSALATRMSARGHPHLATRFHKQADDAVRRAGIIRRALTYNQAEDIREVG